MKKIAIIIWMGIIGLTGTLQAQDSTSVILPREWTLQQCIAWAQANNISIGSQRLAVGSAAEDLLQAKAARLPNVAGSVSQSLVNSKNANPVVGGFQTQANVSGNYGVNASVTLYNGGYLKNDIKAKDLSLQQAGLNVQETQNDITLSITQAYLNILLAKENRVALENVLATSKEQLKQGQTRFHAGSIARKDLVQLEAQVATDEYNLVNAGNTLRLNTLSLKQLLQLPVNYELSVGSPNSIALQPTAPALLNALEAAVHTRPEVRNKEVGLQLAQVEWQKVKAGVKPTVSLGAAVSTGYSDNQSSHYFTQLNNNFYQSLGLTVSIPIYSRRTNKTNIEKAKISIEQAKLSLLNTKTTLSQQVEQAYINWQNAQAQYLAAETQLKASRESYDITNAQLQLGAVNMVELLQQKTAYVQALQSFTQAKYTTVLYNRIYTFYTGEPVALDTGK